MFGQLADSQEKRQVSFYDLLHERNQSVLLMAPLASSSLLLPPGAYWSNTKRHDLSMSEIGVVGGGVVQGQTSVLFM